MTKHTKSRRTTAGRAPAGLGLVILLHMAAQVEITAHTASDAWHAVLTDACLWGTPITTTPIEPTGTTGLTLHAKLPNTASLPYNLTPNVQHWFLTDPGFRQFYPLHVELTTIRHGERTVLDLSLPSFDGPQLATPIGRVLQKTRNHTSDPLMLYWIWEHRLVPTNYGADLVRALEALPDGALVAEGLKGSALYVRIDPVALDPEHGDPSGLIAPLATALVEGAALDTLRTALATRALPTMMPNVAIASEQLSDLPIPPMFRWSIQSLLAMAGYHICRFTNFPDTSLYRDSDDEWACETARTYVWTRHALPVPDEGVADALCQDGVWAYVDRTAAPVQVRFINYRGFDDGRFAFGFAERIVVEREGQAIATLQRWLWRNEEWAEGPAAVIRDNDADADTLPVCVWTADPRTIIAQYHHEVPSAELQAILLGLHDARDLWRFVKAYDTIDESAVTDAVIEALAEHFAPDLLHAEARWHALKALRERRDALASEVKESRRLTQELMAQYPELTEALEPLMHRTEQWDDIPWDVTAFMPPLGKSAS